MSAASEGQALAADAEIEPELDPSEIDALLLVDPELVDGEPVDALVDDSLLDEGVVAGLVDALVDEAAVDEAEVDEAAFDDDPFDDDAGEQVPGARPGHLRVAPKVTRGRAWRRRRARLLVLGVAALSAASMFLLVAFHVFAAQSAFELDKLETQRTNEQRQYGYLRDRVATLSSPDAVAKAAAALRMVRSPEVTLLHAPSAAPFGASSGLPVPKPPDYEAIAAGP